MKRFTICIVVLLFQADLSTTSRVFAQQINAIGRVMPADAAPLDQQIFRFFEVDGTYMEWFKTIYKRSPATDLISEPLVRQDKNYELVPAGAKSWEATPDGYTWIFHLRAGMQWDDGRPFTAHDYVFTFRRGADPEKAYDFEWYYQQIKNWRAVVGRKLPVDSLGVVAIDDTTLAVTTEQPVPYLPHNLMQSWASPEHAVAKYGDEWSTRPEWSVSAGPFKLTEWRKNDAIVLDANPMYRGAEPPYLEQVIISTFAQSAQPLLLSAYAADEVDMILVSGQASLGRIRNDPVVSNELHSMVNFITFYLTMDTYNPPFNDLRVRQAFSHSIDRDALLRSAIRDIGVAAYSMLPPGFPGARPEAFKSTQGYDPGRARQLLAEAGYPDGKGFPQVEIWIRSLEPEQTRMPAEAVQAMVSDVLNIQVGVRVIERKVFTDGLNNHEVALALVPYSQDYPDPSNLLGLWLSSGRHAWHDDAFERLIRQGNEYMGSTKDRFAIYHEAEKRLVEDVGGVFLWHPKEHRLWKSNFRSPDLTTNRLGMEPWNSRALMSGYFVNRENIVSPSMVDRLWTWLKTAFD
ncbi:MAG: peptide ABC transporter substrate-binding protein [Gemmatimonadota bacterium]|nr:peptide ABC transporter substrate-binding protein [Gemmatimonadota bacterium]